MKLIVKARRHLEIPPQLEDYIEGKIEKFRDRLPEPTILEVTLSDELGPKGGLDKEVDLNLTLPREKHTIHLVETSEDFAKSFDLVFEKLEREIERYKELKKERGYS